MPSPTSAPPRSPVHPMSRRHGSERTIVRACDCAPRTRHALLTVVTPTENLAPLAGSRSTACRVASQVDASIHGPVRAPRRRRPRMQRARRAAQPVSAQMSTCCPMCRPAFVARLRVCTWQPATGRDGNDRTGTHRTDVRTPARRAAAGGGAARARRLAHRGRAGRPPPPGAGRRRPDPPWRGQGGGAGLLGRAPATSGDDDLPAPAVGWWSMCAGPLGEHLEDPAELRRTG
jgi:hypothetical protein